ncbi:MAG: uracil-DNA glycosylase [Pseudomonadota bacterium]
MEEARRRRYLEELGITPWVRRARGDVETTEVAAEPNGGPREGASPAGIAPVQPTPMEPVSASPEVVEESSAGTDPVSPEAEGPGSMGWQELEERVASCTACPLHQGRSHTVFGVGDPGADWLVVGEAPGAEEDRRGEPFVGPAGQLLDAMLAALGLARGEGVYIANCIKCRPPENRDPTPEERATCAPWLARQIELVQPRVILAVGRVAAQQLLGREEPLARLRDQTHRWGDAGIPLVVTYHPAYLLRTPGDKAHAWADLKRARAAMVSSGP